MDDAYEACQNELAATLAGYGAQLVPFGSGTPDTVEEVHRVVRQALGNCGADGE
jgi:hypothetical protein